MIGKRTDINRPVDHPAVGLEIRETHARAVNGNDAQIEGLSELLSAKECPFNAGTRSSMKIEDGIAVRFAMLVVAEATTIRKCVLLTHAWHLQSVR
jgi:hypothetical protein